MLFRIKTQSKDAKTQRRKDAKKMELTMKVLTRSTVAALLLMLSTEAALPQSMTGGLVASANQPAKIEPAEPRSMYSQYIDPVNGLTADALVRYALAHNGELAAGRQVIAEARGRLRQAGLRPNPMLEASGSLAVNSPDNNQTFGLELPLELGGRREARISVAERELELRQAEVADF